MILLDGESLSGILQVVGGSGREWFVHGKVGAILSYGRQQIEPQTAEDE